MWCFLFLLPTGKQRNTDRESRNILRPIPVKSRCSNINYTYNKKLQRDSVQGPNPLITLILKRSDNINILFHYSPLSNVFSCNHKPKYFEMLLDHARLSTLMGPQLKGHVHMYSLSVCVRESKITTCVNQLVISHL